MLAEIVHYLLAMTVASFSASHIVVSYDQFPSDYSISTIYPVIGRLPVSLGSLQTIVTVSDELS